MHARADSASLKGMDANNPYTPPVMPAIPATDDISRQLQGIQYPLTLSFKILALASQATVTDAHGRTVLYTKQKLLKFKEHVEIWTDKSQATRLADIKANKVIDWSARYQFTDSQGGVIGSVGRRGWRSLWKAHYETFNPGDNTPDFSIQEEKRFSVARFHVARSGQTLPGVEPGAGGLSARTAMSRVVVPHSARANFACHVPAAGEGTSAYQK